MQQWRKNNTHRRPASFQRASGLCHVHKIHLDPHTRSLCLAHAHTHTHTDRRLCGYRVPRICIIIDVVIVVFGPTRPSVRPSERLSFVTQQSRINEQRARGGVTTTTVALTTTPPPLSCGDYINCLRVHSRTMTLNWVALLLTTTKWPRL